PRWCRVIPLLEALGALQAIEGAVDLDAGIDACGVGELGMLREPLGIEHAAPGTVAPARDADPDGHGLGRQRGGAARIRERGESDGAAAAMDNMVPYTKRRGRLQADRAVVLLRPRWRGRACLNAADALRRARLPFPRPAIRRTP